MVKKINIFNYKFESFCVSSSSIKQDNEDKEKTIKINNDNNNNLIIGCSVEDSNNKNNKNFQEPKNKYIKILVNDPFNNRDIILKVTKKQKGVYVWESLDSKHIYVGHSINLYNRISSYFMPSILKTKARRVLRYLNKHGFSNIKLTIYIMNEKSILEQVVALEQQFIDSLKPNLNVDLVASSSTPRGELPLVIQDGYGSWGLFTFFKFFSIFFVILLLYYILQLDINLLHEIACCDIFSSSFDTNAKFALLFPTVSLFNKSSSESNNKKSVIPLATYAYEDKGLAIKENRGKSGVYRWVNTLTGETYIGSAVSLSKRFSVYFSTKSVNEVLNRSKSKILSALLKYGYSAFRLEILEICNSNQTIDREQYYLDLLKPEYNILSLASSSLGKLHSEETKLKISNSLKGRSLSKEVKEKMSIARTGKIFSEETKNKLSEFRRGKPSPFTGKTHSDETRKKWAKVLVLK